MCSVAEPQPGQEIAPGVQLLAYMSDMRIKESSGVIASRRYADVFWTHNDGGGPKKQVLYAIDREGNRAQLSRSPVRRYTIGRI